MGAKLEAYLRQNGPMTEPIYEVVAMEPTAIERIGNEQITLELMIVTKRYRTLLLGAVSVHASTRERGSGHFGVVPLRNAVRTRTQNQVKMIGENRKPEKFNPELSREQTQLIPNSDLLMVVVLTGNRIITQQKATTNHAIHDMHNRHLIQEQIAPHVPIAPWSPPFKSPDNNLIPRT